MMPQYSQGNPFSQGANSAAYGAFAQPNAAMYGMGYGNPQAMMAGQYAGAYPQAFNPAAGGGSAMQAEPLRSLYLGNFSKDMDPHDVLKCVHTGLVDSFRTMPEKSCAFLTFVEPAAAQMFYQECLGKKLTVGETEIKVGWGKPSRMPPARKLQIQNGATRNVYLGRLTETDTEESIQAAVSQFGPIEQIKLIREKNIAFVHFLNITAASNCVSALSIDPVWKTKRVNYGKDHCADLVDQYNPIAAYGNPYHAVAVGYNPYTGLDPYNMNAAALQANNAPTQRTLYFGNIHPEATCEDLCNIIRGGALYQIRYFPEKHIAFVTFMDAETAMTVHNHASTTGFIIKGRKARVGWGKPSQIPASMLLAFQTGATRNIYLGGIDDRFTVEKLKADCIEFGEIELVNICKEKSCAFVNFTNLNSAVAALQGLKKFKSDYADLKINYGKDRCSNPWKVMKKGKQPGTKLVLLIPRNPTNPQTIIQSQRQLMLKQGKQVNGIKKANLAKHKT